MIGIASSSGVDNTAIVGDVFSSFAPIAHPAQPREEHEGQEKAAAETRRDYTPIYNKVAVEDWDASTMVSDIYIYIYISLVKGDLLDSPQELQDVDGWA